MSYVPFAFRVQIATPRRKIGHTPKDNFPGVTADGDARTRRPARGARSPSLDCGLGAAPRGGGRTHVKEHSFSLTHNRMLVAGRRPPGAVRLGACPLLPGAAPPAPVARSPPAAVSSTPFWRAGLQRCRVRSSPRRPTRPRRRPPRASSSSRCGRSRSGSSRTRGRRWSRRAPTSR